ncbi:MAG: 23S rRNA (cytidine(2498)-2'-O)-methyltransferase RlmM [Pseudomonadota bacterium]|nr:23S rRNA (cytidine(2498)-2'-O)-methyltransferase RlmM [Pseudomonadota bacterium]
MANVPEYGLLALCRAGFEVECAEELQLHATDHGNTAFEKQSGLVRWIGSAQRWPTTQQLIFSRQLMRLLKPKSITLDETNRIESLLGHLQGMSFSAIYLDHPDTNDGKSLARLFEKLQKPLLSAASKVGVLDRSVPTRLHLVFLDGKTVWLATSRAGQTLKWPMGIPRLKMPKDAPSRSTLKLAEAFEFFMDKDEQAEWLREGLTAVDLGACPGGWTYQLVKHGIQVTAIDNGAIDTALMETGLVEHEQADGFVWRPKRKVHWLVCDMVEKPARVADLIGDWLATGDAERAMFNLKLPMKKRLEEVEFCQHLIEDAVEKSGKKLQHLQFRQLYHDREEVTGYAVVTS